jgi:hypothetical protein
MNRKWVTGLFTLLSIPFVAAEESMLQNIWYKFLSVGNLSFLGLSDGSIVVAFTRLLIWIFVFTIFFAVITVFGGRTGTALGFLNRGQAMVVAFVIATITAIFIPAAVLLATGAGWATIVSLLLVGAPIVGIGFMIFRIPGWMPGNPRVAIFLQFLLSILLLWILMVMKFHIGRMM